MRYDKSYKKMDLLSLQLAVLCFPFCGDISSHLVWYVTRSAITGYYTSNSYLVACHYITVRASFMSLHLILSPKIM